MPTARAPRAAKAAKSKKLATLEKSDENLHERAIWRGSISFGLVQIPVGLFRAESNSEIHFTMLDKRNHAQVRIERKNSLTGQPIAWADIVKGYAFERDAFVIMTDEDFAAANVKATGGIDIMDFVDAQEVDPLYYSKPYYLLPQNKGEKTYVLLREALRRANRVGVAKIVIRTRQHLALVREALVLELLRFPHELRPTGELRFPPRAPKAAGINDREMSMADALIASMSGNWDPAAYKDDYRDDLLALIDKKKRQGNKAAPKPAKTAAPSPAEVIDIMALLHRSVAERAPSKAMAKKSSKKKPSKVAGTKAQAKPKPKARPARKTTLRSSRAG